MFKHYYKAEISTDELNEAITALAARMQDMADLINRCYEANRPWEAEKVKARYDRMRAAKIALESAEYGSEWVDDEENAMHC